MKSLFLVIPALALAACASTQNAQQVADYNGDGAISNAEYQQYNKQKDIEDRNVYSESVKRRNTVNVTRDVRDGLWNTRAIKDTIESF